MPGNGSSSAAAYPQKASTLKLNEMVKNMIIGT
jgi:hypothetical protein